MGGARVDKGDDGGGGDGDQQLHRFGRNNPSDRMEGDERRGVIQLFEGLWRVQLQEENPLYQANFEMLFGELLGAIVARRVGGSADMASLCSYARANAMASSRFAGCSNSTSVFSGSQRSAVKILIW
jgi:hypothetical protein